MDKKNKILEAAKELMSQKGYEGTTVRDISTMAKVNVAMISYYFGSKEKLFAAMIEENAGSAFNKIEYIGSTNANPEKKLEALVTLYVDRIFSNRSFYSILNRELSSGHSKELHDHIVAVHTRNYNSFKKIITDGQKNKAFKEDIDIELTMATFLGTISEITNPGKLLHRIYNLKFSGNKSDIEKDNALKLRLKAHLTSLLQIYLIRK